MVNIMFLCKCMEIDCQNTHWGDLTEEQQRRLVESVEQQIEGKKEKEWPPPSIETKQS